MAGRGWTWLGVAGPQTPGDPPFTPGDPPFTPGDPPFTLSPCVTLEIRLLGVNCVNWGRPQTPPRSAIVVSGTEAKWAANRRRVLLYAPSRSAANPDCGRLLAVHERARVPRFALLGPALFRRRVPLGASACLRFLGRQPCHLALLFRRCSERLQTPPRRPGRTRHAPPIAVSIVTLGLLVAVTPASVPGLTV